MIPIVKPWTTEADAAAVARVVRSGWLTEGPECERLVERLRWLTGARYGVLAPNGTLALALALWALGIGEGDEVIVPDATFVATATAVRLVGARPVLADVDPATLQVDPKSVEDKIGYRTRALLPIHLLGTAAPLAELRLLALRRGLLLVEDAAQALGVEYLGRPIGGTDNAAAFSFFADKAVTCGEGGFVAFRDERVWERARRLRNHGRDRAGSFLHPDLGWNLRLTELQAALLNSQLDRFGWVVSARREVHRLYREYLTNVPVEVLGATPDSTLVPFRVAVRVADAATLAHHLRERGVESRAFFVPLHRQPCLADLGYGDGLDYWFPGAVAAHDRVLLLPCYPGLLPEDVELICAAVREFYR